MRTAHSNLFGTNPFVAVVEMCGGVDKIEDLQRHENYKIYDMAGWDLRWSQ